MDKIKVALIGFGGIARVHNRVYAELIKAGYPVELVAVCEKNLERVKCALNFNLGVDNTPLPESVHLYASIDEMIAAEDFSVADICLPTFLHKEMSVKLLSAGKHVLCEKPMALCSDDCHEMLAAAKHSQKRLMIGQCVRFDPAYIFLRDVITDRRFGKLDNLYLDRHSVYPTWGADGIFNDTKKCGGCTIDTHIHDIDVARFLLGEPQSVSAVAFDNAPAYQCVTSTLFYKDSTVVANGSWDAARTKPFEVGYHARFEGAGVVYNGETLRVVPNGNERDYTVALERDPMVEQIRYFLDLVRDEERVNDYNSPESAAASVELIEILRKSATARGEKIYRVSDRHG